MSKEVTCENKEEKFIKISSTGYIDFEITLSLTEQEAEVLNVFPEKIENLSDCQEFLKSFGPDTQQMTFKSEQFKKSSIYDFIRLSSNNSTINSLLVINRAFKKKAFIEFITLSELRFKPENAFLREFVKNISEQNFVFLVENNFLQNLNSKIKFVIKIDNKVAKSFENICEPSGKPQTDSSMLKGNNDKANSLENSLLYNLQQRAEDVKSAKKAKSPAPKSLKSGSKVTEKNERNESSVGRISAKSKVSGKILNQNSNNNLNNSPTNRSILNNSRNLNNSINNNNNNINIRESSNIVFDQHEENLGASAAVAQQRDNSALHDNKSAYSAKKTLNEISENNKNAEEQKLNEQLKLNEGELNELEKELAENKSNNEAVDINKSQINELDETANKILNSIPNVGLGAEGANLNNQSRISNNLPSSQNLNAINITNQSNLADNKAYNKNVLEAAAGEEDDVQVKSKIYSNEDAENKENSRLLNLDLHLNAPKAENENENAEVLSSKNNIINVNINNNINEEANTLSVFERFKYDFSGSDYFFVDMNEMLELKIQNFSISDFYSLLKKITEDHKQITIIISFPNIINNIGFLDLESINILNEIIGLTDIYIFDKKDALALFNLMAQINSEEDNYEDKKNLEQLFIKEIKKKRKTHPKIGIFLDELKRVTIIEQQTSSNLILFHTDYEFDLIPANVSKIISEDYKKLFVVHYEMLKSVFIGGLFSRMLYKKPFNCGFTAGNESLKRVVELLRFNLDAPLDPNFFLIRIKKNAKLPDEEEKTKKKKEQHFTLDCANVLNSKMKEYNPLHDGNLVSYFSSKYIRKHLKNLGFINKKGSIMQDPDNKKLGIIESKKLSKVYEEERVNLQRIKDKKEKLKLQIKNLLQGNNVMKSGNMKEIEKLAKVYNFYPQSDKKLPSVNEFKKSINRNIKINSEIYLKEIQKGKAARSKSNVRSPGRTEANLNIHSTGASARNNRNTLLNVIEKIEDKILNNENSISKISEGQKHNSNNASLRKDNVNNNDSYNNNSRINRSNVNNNSGKNIMIRENSGNRNNNNNIANISGNNIEKVKTKSGKSQISQNSKAENANLKSSSSNKNISEQNIAEEQIQKNTENIIKNNNNNSIAAAENEQNARSDLNENTENNKQNNNNSEIEIKKEVEAEERNVSNDNLNLDANENLNLNNDAENKSVIDNNLNNVSKISKKNDVSGNDLNVSVKKSNLLSEENNNNVSKVNVVIENEENENKILNENVENVNAASDNNNNEEKPIAEEN